MANSLPSVFRNALEVYEYMSRPVCEEAGIQQGELNILLFLAANPDKNTAMDIQKCGGMKSSMISMLVEKLVQGGFIQRQPMPGDRRKVKLVCTEKAQPVVRAGGEVYRRFAMYTLQGASKEELMVFDKVKNLIEKNITECRERMLKGEL